MYLVYASVWIGFLRTQDTLAVRRTKAQFDKSCRYFTSQPILPPLACTFDCRRRGITVRSFSDCLIAQRALEHDAGLLHDGADFEHIAAVARKLRQISGKKGSDPFSTLPGDALVAYHERALTLPALAPSACPVHLLWSLP